jgi:hypothetical protein
LGVLLTTHRISTTISQKHWGLLKKQAEKLGSQQKTLECALECLEKSSNQSSVLTEEEKLSMRILKLKLPCLIQKDSLKMLMDTVDIERQKEYVTKNKPIEYAIEYYLEKPLNECSLKEVIDGLVINSKMSNWFDTVDCTDDCSHYTLKITHSLGLNTSKLIKILDESVFKTYGVKAKSTISEKTIFIKVFKN